MEMVSSSEEAGRASLAARLDADIDSFMEKLAATRPLREKKEFDYDEWCREIEHHPAFMKNLPDGGEHNDTIAALQAMKYDEEDSPTDRALAAKEDGNRCFKHKHYRDAVKAYSEGITLRCPDADLNSVLHANRSAAHLRLKNTRSAAKDAYTALAFNPQNSKAAFRALHSFTQLREPRRALLVLEKYQAEEAGLSIQQKEELHSLRMEAEKLSKEVGRDERKKAIQEKKLLLEKLQLMAELKGRGINFTSEEHRIDFQHPEDFEIDQLQVNLPQLEGGESPRVFLEDGLLHWPTLIVYPEKNETDFIRGFPENSTFHQQLKIILSQPPEWDKDGHYNIQAVQLFSSSASDPNTLRRLPLHSTLAEALAEKDFKLPQPLLTFILLSKSSKFYQSYIKSVHVVDI